MVKGQTLMASEIEISSFPCPACSTRFGNTQYVTDLYFFAVTIIIAVIVNIIILIIIVVVVIIIVVFVAVVVTLAVIFIYFTSTTKCMSNFCWKCFLLSCIKKEVFWRVPQAGKAPVHRPPGSRKGEEQNIATGQHKEPFHNWLPAEGEPHIKAPWFQHYNNELESNRSGGKIFAGNWSQSEEWSAISNSCKRKNGRKTSHKFEEYVISELLRFKTKLATTRSKLTELGRKASNLPQADFGAFKKKLRSKKQTNTVRQNVRLCVPLMPGKSGVLKKFAPGLDEEALPCESQKKSWKREMGAGRNNCYAKMIHLG